MMRIYIFFIVTLRCDNSFKISNITIEFKNINSFVQFNIR